MKNQALAIILATIWVNISEFIRNEFFVKDLWLDGFKSLNLTFPNAPINGAIWGTWALILVVVLSEVVKKYSPLKSTLIVWLLGFVLFWIAFFNLGLLPKGLLLWAVPWSFAEVLIAALICHHFINKNQRI
jgi:hypothetical protein